MSERHSTVRADASRGTSRSSGTDAQALEQHRTQAIHSSEALFLFAALRDNRKLSASEQLREMYLDESYIHQHYHRFDDSLWDPNDEQDLQVGKVAGGGRRYCFMAAVQCRNPRCLSPEELHLKYNMAGLVSSSCWQFCPSRKLE